MVTRIKLMILGAAALALGAAGPAAALAPGAQAAPQSDLPGAVFAPYVDTGFSSVNGALSGSTLSTISSDYGVKYFSLAFVNGSGCQWSMYNSAQYQSEAQQLRSQGGNVLISFGGYNADTDGTDLGSQCSSPGAMAAQVEDVVSYFDPAGIDFDIESSELTDTNDVNLTNQALAMVRSWADGSGHSGMDID